MLCAAGTQHGAKLPSASPPENPHYHPNQLRKLVPVSGARRRPIDRTPLLPPPILPQPPAPTHLLKQPYESIGPIPGQALNIQLRSQGESTQRALLFAVDGHPF